MPKKGERTKAEPQLSPVMRARVKELLDAEFAKHEWTYRDAAKATGIDISTLNKARDLRVTQPATGIGFFIKLGKQLGMSIDDILGLPAVERKQPEKTELALRRETVLAEAIEQARGMGCPERIIQNVTRYLVMNIADDNARREAWFRAFLKAWANASLVPPITKPAKDWLEAHPEPLPEPEFLEEHDEWELRRATG